MKYSSFLGPLLACSSTLISAAPAALPLVESNKLRRSLTRSGLRARAEELQAIADRNNGTRAWGTPGHWDTVKWIYDSVSAIGYYDVEYQYFNISNQVYDDLSVIVGGRTLENVTGFTNGPSATVTAPLLAIPNFGCVASDFPAAVAGKIALVHRGTCNFGLKNVLAGNAGAVGLIVWNNVDTPLNPDLTDPANFNGTFFVPSAFITRADGEAIVAQIGTGTIDATINSIFHFEDKLTANVIAETKGGNHNAVITVGAHSDSVPAGPGINDDGSGTIAQIEVAKALAKFSVNQAVRWCWWSAEEDGLLGSYYYTENLPAAEAAKIVMNLDFDMLASPNYYYSVYDGDGSDSETPYASEGSALIEQTFREFFVEDDKTSVPTAFDGRSDYDGFLQLGIPAGGVFMGAEGIKTAEEAALFGGDAGVAYDPCYHQACDTIKNLNFGAFITGAKSIADSVAKYARSIEGFPFPRPATTPKRAYVKGSQRPKTPYFKKITES